MSSFAHYKSILVLTAVLIGVFLMWTHVAFAAEVQVSPSSGSYSSGQTFTATINVDPQGQSVNAVEANLTFDNTKLSVVNVTKTGSVFSLWTTEPTFSNSGGTIEFGGGSPTPFTGRSTLVTVTFRTLDEGEANVSVSSASALAADGLGTDVYSGPLNATYTIAGAAEPTETPPVETPSETPTEEPAEEDDNAAITFGEPPRAPEIGSVTFLDPELWYATKEGVFTWELPFDVDAVAMDIATSTETEPETIYDPPVEELILTEADLGEGVQYLNIQFKNQVGWGAVLNRKLKIDTEPPEPFVINVRAGATRSSFPLLTFEAKDKTSGVAYYDMKISDGEPFEVTPDEAKLGHLLTDLEDGTYTVFVTAYDEAGNATESDVAVLITAGWIKPTEELESTSIWDFFSGKNLMIILLILIIIGQFVYIMYERRRMEAKEQKLRKETREIQDQMEKIFSALRDEIYDQVNAITKRKRLSKKEREAVEGLNQALEVSETLIEKEITDVQKILK